MKFYHWILIIAFGLLVYLTFFLPMPFQPMPKNINIDKIVVVKHQRKMHIYAADSLIKTYEIALGWQPEGKKRFEGDGKTPEGVYVIHDKNPHSGYHKNLGISYPNQEDLDFAESQEKSAGGLIKIHGIRNGIGWIGRKHLLFDWTNGCIAVTDREIDELYEEIEIGTPIEILP